jgi:DNA-binding LacI/PurR family transcriptional regulator
MQPEKKEIAIVAANFSHVFPSQILKMIDAKAKENGWTLNQYSTSGMEERENQLLKRIFEKEQPFAIILVCLNPYKSILLDFKMAEIPVVIIDEIVDGFTTITTDNFSGGYIAGQYLAKKGKKKVAVISGRLNMEGGYNARQRYDGFLKAMKENKINFEEKNLYEVVNYSYNDGIEIMEKIIKEKNVPDAIFCAAGDMCALGVIKVARENNVKIPEQLSIIGYDDIEQAKISKPALTTIRQPIEQIASAAFLYATNEGRTILNNPKKMVFKAELVERETA